MAKKNLTEFRLKIGDSVIGIISPSEEYANSIGNYFKVENSTEKADIQIKLNFIPHDDELEIPDSLFTTKKVSGNKFVIGSNLVIGEFIPKSNLIDIHVKIGLTKGPVARVFEQILYQAYYNACRSNNSDSFLIHSSGVIYKDKGFLFVGASESGKSTVASLSENYHVLNDEICLINYKDDKLFLHGTPFNGFYKNKRPGSAILETILFLEHGDAHKIIDIKKSQAIQTLAKEIIPPIALNESMSPNIFLGMIDMADRLYKSTTVKKLQFLPDKGFWKEINRIYIGENS